MWVLLWTALAEMLRKKMQGRKGVGTGGSDEEEGAANGHAGPGQSLYHVLYFHLRARGCEYS